MATLNQKSLYQTPKQFWLSSSERSSSSTKSQIKFALLRIITVLAVQRLIFALALNLNLNFKSVIHLTPIAVQRIQYSYPILLPFHFMMSEEKDMMLENDIEPELDWILLRKQLDEEREKDEFIPPYKKNLFVRLGAIATTVSFGYTLLNMNDTNKMIKGASSRIMFQFLTIVMFGAGYYNYTKSPEYQDMMDKAR